MTDVAVHPGSTAVGAAAKVNWLPTYLGFAGMTLGYFMAVLDIQIVASSLVQIQAGVGATNDEISWIQTIYLLTEIVAMPLTAYLTRMFGTRSFYIVATLVFTVASVATGMSESIGVMICMRALQGLAAGSMIPPVFATAMTVFPPEKRVTANVITGMLITLAPTIGPTLGGHLTEVLDWRWLFFINVPVGAAVIFMVGRWGGFDRADRSLGKGLDWTGVSLMAVFLLSTQYVVEEGSRKSWFADDLILWLTVLAVVSGGAFLWRQLTYRQPILSFKPFGDRNFCLGMIISLTSGMGVFSGSFVIPLYLGQIRGLNSGAVGATMLIAGVAMFATGPLVSPMIKTFGARNTMIVGFVLTLWAMSMGMHITDNWGAREFLWLQVVRCVGLVFSLVACQQIAVSTLPLPLMKDASALLNLCRNISGAIGLAMISTLLSHNTAAHYAELAAAFNAANSMSVEMMEGFTGMLRESGAADPEGVTRKAIGHLMHRQASVLAFGDAFLFLTWATVISIVASLFCRADRAGAAPRAAPADLH